MNIEKKFALLGLFATMVAVSIYTFAVGYLSALTIPEFPSYSNAISFFASGLLENTYKLTEWERGIELIKSMLIYIVPIAFIAIYIAAKFSKKNIADKFKFFVSLFFSAVLCAVLFLSFKAILLFLTPVLLPPLISIFEINYINEKWDNICLKEHVVPRIVIIFFLILTSWILPFALAKSVVASNTHLYEQFPMAWGGKDSPGEARMLWNEDGRFYWAYCDKQERTIYGKSAEGNIFFSRAMPDNLKDSLCEHSNSRKN